MSYRDKTRRLLKEAFCVRISNPVGFLVWPSKTPGPRGFEVAAIGFGKSAAEAWKDAYSNAKPLRKRRNRTNPAHE